jgi:hypothetical protein
VARADPCDGAAQVDGKEVHTAGAAAAVILGVEGSEVRTDSPPLLRGRE